MRRVIFLALIALFISSRSRAQNNPDVFQLVASGCPDGAAKRLQTAFVLEGYDGLLTALHGVLGCGSLVAKHESQNKPITDLEVVKVDIGNDVALLHSADLSSRHLQPLRQGNPPAAGATLKILGHPIGLQAQLPVAVDLSRVDQVLDDLLPTPSEKQMVAARTSPDINTPVLSLVGYILPGHSGAPIVDASGHVIGIANGGLKVVRNVPFGWGMPVNRLDLKEKVKVEAKLATLNSKPVALTFNVDTGTDSPELAVGTWSSGEACLMPGYPFDLDYGVGVGVQSDQYDLFYENVDGVERYLRSWRSSAIAKAGVVALESMSFDRVLYADYGAGRFDARWNGGEVRPGTTWLVHTSEGRYAKVRILRSGMFLRFQWLTYARSGEGSLPSPVKSGPCSIEEQLLCRPGLPGDEIRDFHVEPGSKGPTEARLRIDLSYNKAHGSVVVVPLLLDENGENISDGYRPTSATQGTSSVPVLYLRPGSAQSAELLIYLIEEGRAAEAFACRRFPWRVYWGQ